MPRCFLALGLLIGLYCPVRGHVQLCHLQALWFCLATAVNDCLDILHYMSTGVLFWHLCVLLSVGVCVHANITSVLYKQLSLFVCTDKGCISEMMLVLVVHWCV